MLNIAVVASNYAEGKHYIEYKFKDKIDHFNATKLTWTLFNGDIIHLCYGDKDNFISFIYDAFTITPQYISLEDTIKYRSCKL